MFSILFQCLADWNFCFEWFVWSDIEGLVHIGG